MAGNASLNKANMAKQDEFYTQLTDIEKELRHYRKHFQGKTVLCNCDDPFESNFFKYFALNFNRLGLKKLIATCYAGSPIANRQLSLFDVSGEQGDAYMAVVTQVYDKGGDGGVDMCDVAELFRAKENVLKKLKGDGDFRSPECLKLLDKTDIVVTNPPFSLFREYVAVLMEREKKFIIIGPQNSLHYKEIFPLIRDNKMWLGYCNGDMAFRVPDYFEPRETRYWQDETGQKWRSMGNIVWLTNLDIKKRHEELILVKKYQPEQYPTYENYDAIEVGTVAAIPCDYSGMMGVPDTFLNSYNPAQFEIIGLGSGYLGQSIGVGGIPKEHKAMMKSHSAAGDLYYMKEGAPKVPYSRIIIRNLHPEEAKQP